MDTVNINPDQVAAIIAAIEHAANLIVATVAVVCFWLGMNSWESVAK